MKRWQTQLHPVHGATASDLCREAERHAKEWDYVQWADACRGEDKTTSHFDYSGPLSETVLLGTIAIRLPGPALSWNAEKMELTGSPHAQGLLTKSYRSGWQPKWV